MVMLGLVNVIAFTSAGLAIFNIIKDEKEKNKKRKNKFIFNEF